jgi:hypothetical protein
LTTTFLIQENRTKIQTMIHRTTQKTKH